MGAVQANLKARVLRLNPGRRIATVALKPVGSAPSYQGAYVAPSEQLAPVVDHWGRRSLGRLVKVKPTDNGAELDLIIGDEDTWQSLAAGDAPVVGVLVNFTDSLNGDPVGGRVQRVEIG